MLQKYSTRQRPVSEAAVLRASSNVPMSLGLTRQEERRTVRVLYLMCAVWMLNLYDLMLTLLAHHNGFLVETNPIAAFLLQFGPASLAAFKVAMVVFGSYPLLRFRHLRLTECAVWLVIFVNIGVALRWISCYEMYHLSTSGSIHVIEVGDVVIRRYLP